MAISRFQMLIALFIACVVLSPPEPAFAAADTNAAINAIKKNYCRTAGGDRADRPPSVLHVFVRADGNKSYAWVEGLIVGPRALRMASFYFIASKNGRSTVGYSLGYNMELGEQNQDFQEKRDFVFNDNSRHGFLGAVEVGELHVPVLCAVPFDADTPLKLRMIEVIQESVQTQLTWHNKHSGTHYPARVRIAIANFDTDCIWTYVVVRETGEVFSVTLHDSTDPLGDSLLERGDYHVVKQEAYGRKVMAQLRRDSIANGIMREINLANSANVTTH